MTLERLITDYRDELVWLIKRSLPITLYAIFLSILMPTALAFCGYLGKEELDAAGLAISLFEITIGVLSTGIQFSLMPYIAQNITGSKKTRVGVFLQRGIIAAVLLSFATVILSVNMGNILILTGQNAEIAIMTERYLLILTPGFFGMTMAHTLIALTDTTGNLLPTNITYLISCLANLLLHYLFIFHTTLRLDGSAIALAIAIIAQPLIQAIQIWKIGILKDKWSPWSGRAFMEWKKFFKSVLSCCAAQFLWYFGVQIGNFLAGILGKTEIAAESVLFQLDYLSYVIPIGIGNALVARLSFYFGQGQPEMAKKSYKMSLVIMFTCGAVLALLYFALRYEISKLFSLDQETTRLFVQMIPYLSVCTFVQVFLYPNVSLLRCLNRHFSVLLSNFVGFWIVGIPLGSVLTFAVGLGLEGLWIGFATAVGIFAISVFVLALKTDFSAYSKDISVQIEQETELDVRIPVAIFNTEEKQMLISKDIEKHSVTQNRSYAAIKSRLPIFLMLIFLFVIAIIIRLIVPPTNKMHFPNNHTTSHISNNTSYFYTTVQHF